MAGAVMINQMHISCPDPARPSPTLFRYTLLMPRTLAPPIKQCMDIPVKVYWTFPTSTKK